MYRLRYLLVVWSVPLLLSVATFAFVRAGYDAWVGFLFFTLLLLSVGVAFRVGGEALAARIRSGTDVLACRGRRVVVGGGYSALLRKEALVGRPVRLPSGPAACAGWYHAGTSIRDLQAHLRRRGLTLSGHPSAVGTTLGGWIYSNSHGSGGTLWKSSLGAVQVEEQDARGATVRCFRLPHKKVLFGDAARDADLRQYIIREVEVKPVLNVTTERVAFDVRTEADVARFLTTPSFLRLVIVLPRRTTAFVWAPTAAPAGGNALTELLCPPWLATVVPFLFRLLPRRWWTRRLPLSDAHVFGPRTSLPFLELWALSFSFLYDNFEMFVACSVTPPLLHRVLAHLQAAFDDGRLRGRCDVRCGATKLFIDFALTGGSAGAFEVVRGAIPRARIVLHRGKLQVEP